MKALGRSEHSNEERTRGGAVAIMNTAVIRRKRFEVKYCVARRVVHVNFHALLLSPLSDDLDLDALLLSCIIRTAPFGVLKRVVVVVVVSDEKGIELPNGRGDEGSRDVAAEGDGSGVAADKRVRRGRCRRLGSRRAASRTGQNSSLSAMSAMVREVTQTCDLA